MVDVKTRPDEDGAVRFEASYSLREGGGVVALSIRFSETAIARTEEVVESALMADFAEDGRLVGLEVLAPVRLDDLVALTPAEHRAAFRAIAEREVPETLRAA